MAIPNSSTPIDTKILVSDFRSAWDVRYFAGMSGNNYLAWANGGKSLSNTRAFPWAYANIMEEPDAVPVPPNLATLEQRIADLVETVDALQRRCDKMNGQ